MSDATVTTEFRAEAGSMLAEQEKIIHGYQKVNAELRTQLRQAERAGKATTKHGRESTSVFAQLGWTLKGSVIGPLAAMAGPAGVLQMIRTGYESWLNVVREIGDETRKAAGETMAFLALQEAGEKAPRLHQALRLAEQYGIKDRGQAIDTIQAMQSVWGSFEEGMKAAETVFAASRVGIDVPLGKELELFGKNAALTPGQALRMAHVAGEASGRTPKDLAKAAPALKYFTDDPSLAFALATVMTGSVEPGQLGTYTMRGGEELMMTGKLAQWFTEHGVGKGSSKFDRLRALKQAGVDSIEEFDAFGLDVRGRDTLAAATANFDALQKTYEEIQAKAVPGLFGRELAETEAEVPFLKYSRRQDVLETFGNNARLGDPFLTFVDDLHHRLGVTVKAAGLKDTFFGSATGDDDRFTALGAGKLYLQEYGMRGPQVFGDLMRLFAANQDVSQRLAESDAAASQRDRTNELLESIDKKLGGPGAKPMSRPGKDK